MSDDRLRNRLLSQGYTSERDNARLNLEREVQHATMQLRRLSDELADNPNSTAFSGHARQLGQTVAELLTRAGQLDMANRLAFLNPADAPEED